VERSYKIALGPTRHKKSRDPTLEIEIYMEYSTIYIGRKTSFSCVAAGAEESRISSPGGRCRVAAGAEEGLKAESLKALGRRAPSHSQQSCPAGTADASSLVLCLCGCGGIGSLGTRAPHARHEEVTNGN